MNEIAAEKQKDDGKVIGFGTGKMILRFAFYLVCLAILFVAAGRLDWVRGWLFIALDLAGKAFVLAYIKLRNPELMEHRRRIGPGTKSWDKIWLAFYTFMPFAVIVVAGLDAGRYAWTSMPGWLALAGATFYLGGMAISTLAMSVNAHFEATVRIQSDRGHKVIDSGLYRYVRHPGYTGGILAYIGMPLILGSYWALVPAVLTVLMLVLRTALEDRTLHRELDGYAEYAGRTCCRLVPGIW